MGKKNERIKAWLDTNVFQDRRDIKYAFPRYDEENICSNCNTGYVGRKGFVLLCYVLGDGIIKALGARKCNICECIRLDYDSLQIMYRHRSDIQKIVFFDEEYFDDYNKACDGPVIKGWGHWIGDHLSIESKQYYFKVYQDENTLLSHNSCPSCNAEDGELLYSKGLVLCRLKGTKGQFSYPGFVCPHCHDVFLSRESAVAIHKLSECIGRIAVDEDNAKQVINSQKEDSCEVIGEENAKVLSLLSTPDNWKSCEHVRLLESERGRHRCPDDKTRLLKKINLILIRRGMELQGIKIGGYYCPTCETAYLSPMHFKKMLSEVDSPDNVFVRGSKREKAFEKAHRDEKRQKTVIDTRTNSGNEYKVSDRIQRRDEVKVPDSVVEDPIKVIQSADFIVRSSKRRCLKNHNVEDIKAIVRLINLATMEKMDQSIAAGFCPKCNAYFILESTYQALKRRGHIMCKVCDNGEFEKLHAGQRNNRFSMSQESLLMLYGYSVSQTRGLTTRYRQAILAMLIEEKIMTKMEIVSYLDYFIRIRRNQPSMRVAISKWNEDKAFVESYWLSSYRSVRVNQITRK